MKSTRVGAMLVLGNDEVRIEEGPVLKTATATAELLSDDNTAPHYFEGLREEVLVDAEGNPFTQQKLGVDALGKRIKVGEEMSYLAHGGRIAPKETCFYIYKRRELVGSINDPSKQFLPNGDVNPYFVPEHVRDAPAPKGPKSRTHMTYVFDEVGTAPTEEAAIEKGEKLLAKSKE